MANHHMSTVVVLLGVLCVVVAQRLDEVCKDVPNDKEHNHQRPLFNSKFKVDVECAIKEHNTTVSVREYIDRDLNRGRINVVKAGHSTDFYMDYDLNTILKVDMDNGVCEAGLILFSKEKFFLGFSYSGQKSHMFSPGGALHFSYANESYGGQGTVRGIAVDQWHSCQYVPSINATAHVTWSFSRSDVWYSQIGYIRVPVRMAVKGKQVTTDGKVRDFDHIYDFFDYIPQDVEDWTFEVPSGIYCPGRNDAGYEKPFPNIANTMYFHGEINDRKNSKFTYLMEVYDGPERYSMFIYKTDTHHLHDMNRFVGINDYNSGVSYVVDRKEESCKMMAIKDAAFEMGKFINNDQIRMETPREFLMDANVKYQYADTTTVRGMKADRWIGVSDTLRGFLGINVTLEWFFKYTPDKKSGNQGSKTADYGVPLMVRVFPTHLDVSEHLYDIQMFDFGFMDTSMWIQNVDVSPCFKGVERQYGMFAISGSFEPTVREYLLKTTFAIKSAIGQTCKIAKLRIADVRMDFSQEDIWVTFDLLDRPPSYNDIGVHHTENGLRDAAQLLLNAFDDIEFHVTPTESLKPLNGTLCLETKTHTCVLYSANGNAAPDTDNSGFSAGALAGLGVGMLVAGGATGALVSFLIYGRRP